MRLFAEDRTPSVHVSLRDGHPRLINFRGRTYCVRRVLQQWSEIARSWSGSQERACYLVETHDNTMEVHHTAGQWHLEKMLVDTYEGEVLPRLAA